MFHIPENYPSVESIPKTGKSIPKTEKLQFQQQTNFFKPKNGAGNRKQSHKRLGAGTILNLQG